MKKAASLASLGTLCLIWAAAPAQATHTTTPPITSITHGPGSRTTDTTPKFRFESNKNPSSFVCKVDGAKFKPCTSPKVYKHGLTYGRHGFYVKAIDAYGNIDRTAAAYSFKIVRS
jgi:hypothetical protein